MVSFVQPATILKFEFERKVPMVQLSPKPPVRFSGMYHFVPPESKKESFKSIVNAHTIDDFFAKTMYERDEKKGELKQGDPRRSITLVIRDRVVGFTGNDALTMLRKVCEKGKIPEKSTWIEALNQLITGRGGDHHTAVVTTSKHIEEAFDEHLKEKDISPESLEKIKFTDN